MKAASWRVVTPWCLLAALLVATTGSALWGISTGRNNTKQVRSAPRVKGLPTGFGGYYWKGQVNEISAEWIVPRVLPTAEGSEATWVGAQGTGPDEPFIQLGTIGYGSDSPQPELGGSPGPVTESGYEVFWSDTTKGFRAVPIVRLSRPGDLIMFEMTKVSQGWQLHVRNLTVGWSRSVTVDYGINDSFSYGEWLQEDPAMTISAPGDVPYANTTSVSFKRVRMNGRIPTLRYEDEQALSTAGGTYLIPTPLRNGSFSLVVPKGPALQYLTDAEKFDSAAAVVEAQMSSWGGRSANPQQIRTVDKLALVFGASAEQLRGQRWPPSARSRLSDLQSEQLKLKKMLEGWVHATSHPLSGVRQILESVRVTGAANLVRKSLGLPPV